MPEQEVNIPLLRKYVEWVEEQEALPLIDRNWMQLFWLTPQATHAGFLADENSTVKQRQVLVKHCGTAYCMAGKIAADHDERYQTQVMVNGVHAATLAANLLGVPEHQLRCEGGLFDGSNTAVRIRQIAEKLAGEEL